MTAWTMDQQHSIKIDRNIPGADKSKTTDWKGNSIQLITDNGKLILNLDSHPQYITLPKGF
jgi:hypothetical protein